MSPVRYRSEILLQLAEYGLFPRPHTPPALVQEYLKALYTMEVRFLRAEQEQRQRIGEKSNLRDYAARVVALRERYAILSLPIELWTS